MGRWSAFYLFVSLLLGQSVKAETLAGPSYANFGFNAPWMFAVTHGPSSTIDELTAAAKLMNNASMRFPGGTVSVTYHFNLPGYDGTQPGETENYIIPFTKIFAPVGSAPLVKINFLPNIEDHFKHINYHGSDEDLIQENLQTLSYLLDHGFSVDKVELGNETFLRPESFWSFGTSAWKPLENLDQNVKALVEIKWTYALNQAYQEQHFKEGLDKYIKIMQTYKSRINALMDSRKLPRPLYGIPIPPISSMNYSDIKIWNGYYLKRIRDLRGTDALIPHYYYTYKSGNSAAAINDLKRVINDYKNFFGINNTANTDLRRFWFTEFSVNEKGADNVERFETQEQMNAFSQMAAIFSDPNSKTDQFMIHQFFKDGADYGVMYKNSNINYNPVNGTLSSASKVPNPVYQKSLFYSPRFCLAVKWRGASVSTYDAVQKEYGCP